jgi:hypothetical protein
MAATVGGAAAEVAATSAVAAGFKALTAAVRGSAA